MPKGCQNGTTIDAKTHQQPMPKMVTEKIIKAIIIHVFLNGKIICIHCKNNGFEGFTGSVRERKRYQTNIKNDKTIHTKIDERAMQNSCSKK